jgi:hypothetical protein
MKKKIFKIIEFLKAVKIDDTLHLIDESDILLFCHDVDRSINLSGRAYSPLLDSVREDLERRGMKCTSISYPFSSLTGGKGYASPLSFNRSFLLYKLIKIVLDIFIFIKYPNYFSPYNKILRKSNAKLIITIGCTDDLCFSARLNKVFHVELIHGIGYTSIPWGWENKECNYLPQGILAMDRISAGSFSLLSSKGIVTKLIPHPFLKRFVDGSSRNIPAEWIPNKSASTKWKKTILVSLSWGYAGDHKSYEQFANILRNGLFFDEIEKVISEESDIFWRFRFHPVQMKAKRYKHLLKYMDDFASKYPNTEWKESSTLPFPSIVMTCDGNISMSSMSCYDAATFGVTSLMLCPTLLPGGIYSDMFSDLEEEGYVIKAKPNVEFIKFWISNACKISFRLTNIGDDQPWEEAVEWMLGSVRCPPKSELMFPPN